jgi:hypothetical protein
MTTSHHHLPVMRSTLVCQSRVLQEDKYAPAVPAVPVEQLGDDDDEPQPELVGLGPAAALVQLGLKSSPTLRLADTKEHTPLPYLHIQSLLRGSHRPEHLHRQSSQTPIIPPHLLSLPQSLSHSIQVDLGG